MKRVAASLALWVATACPLLAQQHDPCWLQYEGLLNSGTNPSHAAIKAEMQSLALASGVPYEIVAAVCYQESTMRQFAADGHLVHNQAECKARYMYVLLGQYPDAHAADHSSAASCPYGASHHYGFHWVAPDPPGLGMMQLTGVTAQEYDVALLRTDWEYNLWAGVDVLKTKFNWYVSQAPTWMQADIQNNWMILENWYLPVWAYNGYLASNSGVADLYLDGLTNVPEPLPEYVAPVAVTRPYPLISHFWNSALGEDFVADQDGTWTCEHGNTYTGAVHVSATADASPPAPTGLSPNNWTTVSTSPIVLSCAAVSVSPSVDQYQFEVQKEAAAQWASVATSAVSANSSDFFPTGTSGNYRFRVRAHNALDWGPPSAWAYFKHASAPPPAAPSITTPASGTTVTSLPVAVQWSAVPGADFYYFAVTSVTGTLVQGQQVTLPGVSVPSLPGYGSYTVYVWAFGSGGYGPYAATDFHYEPAALPGVPTGLDPSGGSVASSPVLLKWNASAWAETYDVFIAYGSTAPFITEEFSTAETQVQTPLPVAGMQYYWTVRAVSGTDASDWSTLAEFFFPLSLSPPAAPTGLSPSGGATLTTPPISLDWSDVTGIDYYAVEVYKSGALVFQEWPTGSTDLFTPSAAGTYTWTVWAHNAAGWSPGASASFSYQPGGGGGDEIEAGEPVLWPMSGQMTAVTHDQGGYCDEYMNAEYGPHKGTDISSGGNAPVHAAASGTVVFVGINDPTAGNFVVIHHGNGYKTRYLHLMNGSVQVSVDQQVAALTPIGVEGATGLVFGTHLHFEFFQDGDNDNYPDLNAGEVFSSPYVCGQLPSVSLGAAVPGWPPVPGLEGSVPPAPTALTPNNVVVSASPVTLSCGPISAYTAVDGYEFLVFALVGAEWQTYGPISSGGNSISVPLLTTATEYAFYARAHNEMGWGGFSFPAAQFMYAVDGDGSGSAPPVPTGLNPDGTWLSSSPITLSWNPSAGATQYEISVTYVTSGFTETESFFSETASLPYSPPVSGSNYSWKVRAGNSSGGWSDWSAVAQFFFGSSVPPTATELSASTGWHTLSVPNVPTGETSLQVGSLGSYATSGGSCSWGHELSYGLAWGDGAMTDFGGPSGSHVWSSAGTFSVRAKVHCSGGLTSANSGVLSVQLLPWMPQVRFVYFVPSDRSPQPGYRDRLDRTATFIRDFFESELADAGLTGRRFYLDIAPDGKVRIDLITGEEIAEHYRKDLWTYVLGEVLQLYDLDRTVVVIVHEAYLINSDGSVSGGFAGGTRWIGTGGGVALLGADALPLMDPDLFPDTTSIANRPDLQRGMSLPLWWHDGQGQIEVGELASTIVGGCAHELGHALGLSHYYRNENSHGLNDSNRRGNLMGNGLRGIRNIGTDWCDVSTPNARILGNHFIMRRLVDRTDTIAPICTAVSVTGATVTVQATDSGGSGLALIDFRMDEEQALGGLQTSLIVNGNLDTAVYTFTDLQAGTRSFEIIVRDREGNDSVVAGGVLQASAFSTAPAGLFPSGGAVVTSSPVSLTWSPPAGATQYEISVMYVVGGSTQTVTLSSGNASLNYSPPVTGSYYSWRVRAGNSSGVWSDWSAPAQFFFGSSVPAVPTGLSPSGGTAVTTSPVSLTWNPSAGATLYQVEINYQVNGTWITDPPISTAGTSTPFPPPYANVSYFWRVRAQGAGLWSQYSASTAFSYSPPVAGPPAVPTPLAPAPWSVQTTTPVTLSWTSSAGATLYQVEVNYQVNGTWITDPPISTAGTSTPFPPPYANVSYFWRVRAQGAGLWSQYSASTAFTYSPP